MLLDDSTNFATVVLLLIWATCLVRQFDLFGISCLQYRKDDKARQQSSKSRNGSIALPASLVV